MLKIAGYQIHERLYSSSNSHVYRAQCGDEFVILKLLSEAYPSPERVVRFKREYEVTRQLSLTGVVEVYALEQEQNRWLMVIEDFGGESLSRLGMAGQLTIGEFLKLAIKITEILGQIHACQIMHKDINPANLVWNRGSGEIKVIDFGISTALSRENPAFRHPSVLEGTLAYMSPEQTGRMNRAMDYRTDFYSLGVTFYELLTGQLPFVSEDVLSLVHSHIAKVPVPPHELKGDIPEALSQVVLKLMAKNAEARYQSARGISADLRACLRQLSDMRKMVPFVLGRGDVSDRFRVPDKLYGREKEIARLLAAFEQVANGASQMMLVAGYSGIGKSALVQEVYKPITARRGYFISGKFDLLQRDVPYAAFIQAVQSLVRQLLTESVAQIATWKARLLTALGANGQVIVDVIPDVALILGPQPAVPELEARENQNRFNLVFQSFIRVFTQPAHPLTIFLDDLQWADRAMLSLIEILLTAPDVPSLFLIGAYRDNEVSKAHPLMLTVGKLKKAAVKCQTIVLPPLVLPEVTQLVADTLHRTAEQVQPLARRLQAKTGGNPFFLGEFLKALHADALLTFDYQSGYWQWDLAQIEAQEITDNVAQLMAAKVRKLPHQTQAILKLAACIGNQFELEMLAVIATQTPQKVARDLWSSLDEGVVQPLSDAYKFSELSDASSGDSTFGTKVNFGNVVYKFAHDRIQQAVYDLILAAERQAMHLRIGQYLNKNIPSAERIERVFEIVNHLNQAHAILQQPSEHRQLASLNLTAGQRAKRSTAYEPALRYLQVGLTLLPADSWQQQYKLTLGLHLEASEVAFLMREYDLMAELCNVALDNTRNLLDRAKAIQIKVAAYKAQRNLQQALETSMSVLAELGVRFPKKPNQAHVLLGLLKTKLALRGERLPSLLERRAMNNSHALITARFLGESLTAAYSGHPALFPLICFEGIALSVKYGLSADSALCYVAYGIMLCGVVGEIEAGFQIGQFALQVVDKLSAKEIEGNISGVVNGYIAHWKEDLRTILPRYLDIYERCMETNNLEHAAINVYNYLEQALFAGCELSQLEQERALYDLAAAKYNNESFFTKSSLINDDAIPVLMGGMPLVRIVDDSYFNEITTLKTLTMQGVSELIDMFIRKIFINTLFQAYSEAERFIAHVEPNLDSVVGKVTVPVFYCYAALTYLAQCGEAKRTKRLLKKVATYKKKLRKWGRHAPTNYQHKYLMVEAEYCRVLGKEKEAQTYYDQAIALAHQHHYLHEEGLAHELAGRFYLAQDTLSSRKLAQIHLRDAHYAYERWGAIAKVKDLEERYPKILLATMPTKTDPSIMTSSSTGRKTALELDFSSVLKVSQAISCEIMLDKLLAKIIQIVNENAGAQSSHLILESLGVWTIQATANIEEVTVLQSIPLSAKHLPLSVINVVIRTEEAVVLNDATGEGPFIRDDYIINQRPQSILCAPLLNQGELIGILYLENKLTTGAFTPQRLEVLNLLSSQAAISIKNATLVNTLEQQVAQRTQELYAATVEAEEARAMAEKANQAKSIFLANMSHELRTPLNAILGFAEIMTRHQKHYPTDQRHLEIIKRSGEHLLTLINNVLDLSKIEAGQATLNPTSFDLWHLLDELEAVFQVQAQKKGLYFLLDYEDYLPRYLYADGVKLHQVLNNLLSNAIKYTEQGGVSLYMRKSQAGQLHVEVADTGVGISNKDLDCLFEAFTQTEVGKYKQEGTGLGLPISQQFVRLMGGEITVESQVGRGTCFMFDIQVEEIDAPEEEQKQPARRVMGLAPNQPRYRILIVDDRWDNRQLLIDLLKPLGFELQEASNGQEAIAQWRKWQPDMIWMDIRMPIMDGREAARHIKKNSQGQTCPIIALTASIYEEEEATLLEAGCDDFLRKPFRPEQIFDLMIKHLGVRYLYHHDVFTPQKSLTMAEAEVNDLLTPTALSRLPAEWREHFLRATMELNLRLMLAQIKLIRSQNEPLADGLTALATRFQFEKIADLLEKADT